MVSSGEPGVAPLVLGLPVVGAPLLTISSGVIAVAHPGVPLMAISCVPLIAHFLVVIMGSAGKS
jgi:hypothetical protein